MSVVKINAIEVPEGAGPELEKRFAARMHAVDQQPGFLGFELLRPVSGETRYFVYTKWETEEHYQAWAKGCPAASACSRPMWTDSSRRRASGTSPKRTARSTTSSACPAALPTSGPPMSMS